MPAPSHDRSPTTERGMRTLAQAFALGMRLARHPLYGWFEHITVFLAQAIARALVCERENVAADWDVVVVIEDPVRAAADQLGRAGLTELFDQLWKQLLQ